ncbi:hypothetical protein M9Y10_001696 [Tritrichomonas musculus]|uniref:DUF3447 domain-containing protein n=1 Tax=Tritrichomonas musculus TaxID=1915356 RepID=A0ABR2L7P6_9EUKA
MSVFNHFLRQEYISDAQELAILQEKIFEATPDTVKDTIEWISVSKFSSDIITFLSTIVKATLIRPKDIDLHTILVLGYASKNNCTEKIKELLLHKFILNSERLILFLARERFFTPLEISNAVASMKDLDIALFAFFSPEISAFHPEMIDNFDSLFDEKQLMPFELKFYKYYRKYKKNDWELLNDRRFNIYEQDSIEEIVMNDDLDRFVPYLKSEHYDPHYIIQYTAYTPTLYPFDQPNLIQFAALWGSVNIFMALVKLVDTDISVRNEHNVSLANFAVAGGNEDIIDYLVDKRKSDFYNEALQSAAKFHRNKLFKKIYENLPSPEYKLRFGTALDTVFNCCVSEENAELIMFCLANGFDINKIGMYDTGPVHIALTSCSPFILSLILNISDIKLNSTQKGIDPPFFTAVQMKNLDIVRQFIELGKGENPRVDISVKDEFGRTAIFFAAESDDVDMVKILFETGKYDINYRDKFGQTIAHLAAMNNSLRVVKFLLDHAYPDLGIIDICGRTPVQMAIKNENSEIKILMSDYSLQNESSDPDTDDEEEENFDDDDDIEEEEEENEEEEEEEEEEDDNEEEEEEKKDNVNNIKLEKKSELDKEFLGDLLEFKDQLNQFKNSNDETGNKAETNNNNVSDENNDKKQDVSNKNAEVASVANDVNDKKQDDSNKNYVEAPINESKAESVDNQQISQNELKENGN